MRSLHCLLVLLLLCPALAAQEEPAYTIRVRSELVQISVVVRDRKGQFVRGLTKDDFTLLEDGRPQQLSAIDLETVVAPKNSGGMNSAATLNSSATPAQSTPALPSQIPILSSRAPAAEDASRGLRLVVLFFDFTSLEPADAARSVRAAEAYIKTMGAADRVAVTSLAAKLEVVQDFTADQAALQQAVKRLKGLSRVVVEGAEQDAGYAAFSDYRRLRALRALSGALAQVRQKKSVVIFAGGVGADDLAAITATVDDAVRAGVSFYGIDAQGLTATPPLGDASTAGGLGRAVLSGTAVAMAGASTHDQDLLYALARGTGGRAFFDSNDFERPFRTMEQDTSEYYLLSYRSSNSKRDGRYRRISVRISRSGLQVAHQQGYYGPRDTKRASPGETESVLTDELAADLPMTALPVYGFVNYVRTGKDQYYVPITIVLPSEALLDNGVASSAAVGLAVLDSGGHMVRKLRDVIPASVVTQHPTWAVQYATATELPAGDYTVRLAVIQNGNGQVGSFRTRLQIAQPEHARMLVSPVLGGTLASAEPQSRKSPLILNGSRLIWNPLSEYGAKHAFAMQYQVERGATGAGESECDPQRMRSSLQCFASDQRVFNAEPAAAAVTDDAAVFRVEFPGGSLPPGAYKCRVTAVEPQCGGFAFGSTEVKIRDEAAGAKPPAGGPQP